MAYDQHLEDRISRILKEKGTPFDARKMMGGLCYMVDDKMCVGIVKDHLMARVGTEIYESVLSKPGCKPMDFTGRPMKGFVFVGAEGIDQEDELNYWIQLCLDFNPMAKSSKKKK
ncbi:MAG: TfoX/Sxy family protein [Cytophagales bacterium]|nr:TfoX/Sxy family protein [Cytophagales bacterium]